MNIIPGLRLLWILCLSLMMVSCAIETREPAEKEPAKVEKIIISEQAQQQFDEALKLLDEKHYEQAVNILNQLVKEESRFAAPFVNLGMAYKRMGDPAKAEENLRRAVDIDLGNAQANNELGMLYRKQGRFADARKAYENALADHPDYLPALQNLGILCDLYMGDLECALNQYEKYLDIEDNKNIKIWITDLKRRM